MSSVSAVRAVDVVKRYRRTMVLDRVSFSLRTHKICVLVGANGAGKSTLIRLISDLARPDSGSITIFGRNPEKAAGSLAVLFEEPNVYPHLDGHTNLCVLAGKALRSTADDELLSSLGLTDSLLSQRGKTFSFGQRRRLTLAAALWRAPALLVLDEPTNGLDPDGASAFVRTIERLRGAEETTILITGQDLATFDALADDVLFLRHGKVESIPDWQERRSRSTSVLTMASSVPELLSRFLLDHASHVRVKVDGSQVAVEGDTETLRALLTAVMATPSVQVSDIDLRRPNLQDMFTDRESSL